MGDAIFSANKGTKKKDKSSSSSAAATTTQYVSAGGEGEMENEVLC